MIKFNRGKGLWFNDHINHLLSQCVTVYELSFYIWLKGLAKLQQFPFLHQAKSILGDHLTNVGLNRDNVSEVLQLYMEAHCSQTELADLTLSLRTKAFQAHTPAQKATVLTFLVHELSCSKSVVR